MAVRAKMTVTGIKDDTASDGTITQRTVTLHAVYDPDPNGHNRSWSKYTPWGQHQMAITNPAAFEQFEQGKTYYVDFTPADD